MSKWVPLDGVMCLSLFSSKQCIIIIIIINRASVTIIYIKKSLDEVSVISGIIKSQSISLALAFGLADNLALDYSA